MQSAQVTLLDRRRYADANLAVRWRVMVVIAAVGVLFTLALSLFGRPFTRADEGTALVLTVLGVGLSPVIEWVGRLLFGRAGVLEERLEAANQEVEKASEQSKKLREALHIEDFNEEAEEFGSIAALFWERLEKAFSQYMVAEVPYKTRTLREFTATAPWPDEIHLSVAGVTGGAEDVLPAFSACVYPEYGFELIPRDRFGAFDALVRNIRRRVRQWGEGLETEQRDELFQWLRNDLSRSHATTVKMAWYLEIANGRRVFMNVVPHIDYYRVVREVMEPAGRVEGLEAVTASKQQARQRRFAVEPDGAAVRRKPTH